MAMEYDVELDKKNLERYQVVADNYVQELIDVEGLNEDQRLLLQVFARHYAVWLTAMDSVKRTGIIQITPRGFLQKASGLSIAEAQADMIKKLANEIGISAKGKKQIGERLKTEPTDLDSLLG